MDAILGGIVFFLGIWFLKSISQAISDAHLAIAQKPGKLTAEGFNWGTGGYCIEVYDGNTIRCHVDGRNVVVRLFGMNAPEESEYGRPSQPFAREATTFLADKIHNAWVGILPIETDKFSRTIGRVLLGEEDVTLAIIKMGLAKASRENLKEPFLTEYVRAEEEAKKQRLGMWSQGTPLKADD